MEKVKMYFGRLSVPEKIQKARNLVAHMDGNTNFPNPSPALAELSAAANELEQAYEAALNRGKIEMAWVRQCDAILGGLVVAMAGYVQSVSRGEGGIILSSGFDVQPSRTHRIVVDAPLGLRGMAGSREGEITLSWAPVRGARAYNIQMSLDGGASWTYYGSCTKRRMVVSGLASGVNCYFRVAAISAQGQTGWSDPGLARAM